MRDQQLIYGVNLKGFVVLGLSDYNYAADETVMSLIRNLKKVQLDDFFDAELSFLPDGITDLNIGANFNKSLDNLPSTLKHLRIQKYNEVGYNIFNQPIDYLPHGLETLIIGFNIVFNQTLDNLPSTLKTLHIYNKKSIQDINNLPDSIEELRIDIFEYDKTFKLPKNLKSMYINKIHKAINGNCSGLDFIERIKQSRNDIIFE